MCEEHLTAPTHLRNYADLLIEQELVNPITEPNYDDVSGLINGYHAARDSQHTTQVGAYITTHKVGVSGHNNIERRTHAESNAVATASRLGVRTQDATMYAPWASCSDCAGVVRAAGIRRVVTHATVMDLTSHKWQANVQQGLRILRDGGVQVDMVMRDKITGFSIMFNGEEVWV